MRKSCLPALSAIVLLAPSAQADLQIAFRDNVITAMRMNDCHVSDANLAEVQADAFDTDVETINWVLRFLSNRDLLDRSVAGEFRLVPALCDRDASVRDQVAAAFAFTGCIAGIHDLTEVTFDLGLRDAELFAELAALSAEGHLELDQTGTRMVLAGDLCPSGARLTRATAGLEAANILAREGCILSIDAVAATLSDTSSTEDTNVALIARRDLETPPVDHEDRFAIYDDAAGSVTLVSRLCNVERLAEGPPVSDWRKTLIRAANVHGCLISEANWDTIAAEADLTNRQMEAQVALLLAMGDATGDWESVVRIDSALCGG